MSLDESAELKAKVMDAFLVRAAEDGWTSQVLLRAGEDAGVSEIGVWALFPDKAKGALDTWNRMLDLEMQDKVNALDLGAMKIRERIFWCVRTRLTLMIPHKSAAQKAFRFLLMPTHAAAVPPMIYESVHLMWCLAGDKSADYNFYTKRALLSGVYIASALFWLKDTSPEHHKTWTFLEKRIANVLSIQKLKKMPILDMAKSFWPFS